MSIVFDLPELDYHAHPALSSTEARLILDAPAKYRWRKDHPPLIAASKKFDIGSAIHSKVLGTGYEIDVIPADILASNGAISTTAAKAFVAKSREEGRIPILQDELDMVDAAAESVLANPNARAIFHQPGHREASVFASAPETRARFDFLPDLTLDRPVAADLKSTAGNATANTFGKAVINYGYDVQEGHYEHVLANCDEPGNEPAFAFIVVEKDPPYLVAVFQLPPEARERGRRRAQRARDLFTECTITNVWPGRPEDVQFIDVPNWVAFEEEIA